MVPSTIWYSMGCRARGPHYNSGQAARVIHGENATIGSFYGLFVYGDRIDIRHCGHCFPTSVMMDFQDSAIG